mmetsp:Transcript_59425/g.140448  ORF Transcript_59425/g.140448 Transcript_59425/m.140448 type:complete len:277 (-) Transcript_59425:1294-2124(-)
MRRGRAAQAVGTHRHVEALAPVVEVAGHQHRGAGRDMVANEMGQPVHLAQAAGMDQPEVGHHHMQLHPLPLHRHMQQPALLEGVVGHVMVADGADREARQQRIAMLTMLGDRVGAVGHRIAAGGEELGLPLVRPAEPGVVKLRRIAVVEMPDLLQADEVGVQRGHTHLQVVDFEPLGRPEAAHALVDVVGRHPQHRAGRMRRGPRAGPHGIGTPTATKRGSCSTASALDGEKQRSAAWAQGSHCQARCSRGASVGVNGAGSSRPKTCSVLRVTPGA